MVRDEIKKSIIATLKVAGEQKRYKKELLDAFDAKAEELITRFEKSIYSKEFQEEIKTFKYDLLEKSKFEKFIEKTSFLVPLLFSLFFIRIIYKINKECENLDILQNYQFELSAVGILLTIWFLASLFFVFKKS